MKRTFNFLIAVLLVSAVSLVLVSCTRSEQGGKPADVDYYTCTMHPSVKKQNPTDKCPICSMDLVPVKKKGAAHDHGHTTGDGDAAKMGMSAEEHAKMKEGEGKEQQMPGMQGDMKAMPGMKGMQATEKEAGDQPTEFVVPSQRQQEFGVTYAAVETKPLHLDLRAVGSVTYNTLKNWTIVSRVEGYVDKLFVASKGDLVTNQQPIITIYSPDILTTEQEFFDLLKSRDEEKKTSPTDLSQSVDALIESAKTRMRLWNLTDAQIAELERTRKSQVNITLYAPVRGLVQQVQVTQGQKVMPGDRLVEVTDLSNVWVWAEFYQEELPLLETNLPVIVNTSAYPGLKFKGRISVIDPFVNQAKRVVRARIDIENPEFKLRPDMYVDIELQRNMGNGLTIPVGAIMPTGKSNVVFVDKGEGRIEPRFVELGRKYADVYEVRRGLNAGERVVASGNFLIDAEAKVQGALKGW
jgi:Cu(I)/Ag(I) efflux system membrane fusion protein